MLPLLDGSKEAVHVYVEDNPVLCHPIN
jgi:hypothetical protein